MVEESPSAADARIRVYRLRPGSMADLREWLDETERLWAGQFAPA